MFESLRKKLTSFFGKSETEKKTEEKVEPIIKKTSKKTTLKKIDKETPKKPKKEISKKPKEKILETPIQKIIEETEVKEIEKPEEKETLEKPKEKQKKGFLSSIFGKKETLQEEKIEEKKSFFSKIFSSPKITQENIEEIFADLEIILLENSIALEVVDDIKANLLKELIGKEVKKSEIESTIISALKNSISSVLIEPENLIERIKSHEGIFTIIFFGINGSGKTTSIAKLANYLKNNKISSVLVAGDTFRAAAIQQLEMHAQKIGVPIIKHDYGSDPSAVAFDAKNYAKKNGIKCVLIDTAGRMYTKDNLLKEMEKIIRVSQPNLKIFVGESITGNDAVEQARTFNETAGIDGSILTKADVDEKGGAILSISSVTKKPIYFLGVGQTYDDFEIFNKKKLIEKLGI